MTNKEKYKKAFSALEPHECSFQEVEQMAVLQKKTKMKIAAAMITGCVLLGGTGTAYAMNVGESSAWYRSGCMEKGQMQ